MQHVQETNLAWSLIDVAKPELDARERNHVFISVGAGDSFTSIRILLKLIAVKRIPVKAELVQLCDTWLGRMSFMRITSASGRSSTTSWCSPQQAPGDQPLADLREIACNLR